MLYHFLQCFLRNYCQSRCYNMHSLIRFKILFRDFFQYGWLQTEKFSFVSPCRRMRDNMKQHLQTFHVGGGDMVYRAVDCLMWCRIRQTPSLPSQKRLFNAIYFVGWLGILGNCDLFSAEIWSFHESEHLFCNLQGYEIICSRRWWLTFRWKYFPQSSE
jgi:hypothetical protein